ncbi:MAG: hypothetical protein IPL84_17170 [Chitinophagaceae bacterium]|nr:hypothetical protein [Chitinophagaceae bacterium]
MKKWLCSLIFFAAMQATGYAQHDSLDQSSPTAVAKIIFNAASSGNYEPLKQICDPNIDTDGDSKRVCAIADADKISQENFAAYFSTGKIIGDPLIKDNFAKVDILFGPDGKKPESLMMARKDNKWYLVSF